MPSKLYVMRLVTSNSRVKRLSFSLKIHTRRTLHYKKQVFRSRNNHWRLFQYSSSGMEILFSFNTANNAGVNQLAMTSFFDPASFFLCHFDLSMERSLTISDPACLDLRHLFAASIANG